MPHRRQALADWRRIRALFRERRAAYTPEEVPRLTGIHPATLHEAIASGAVSLTGAGRLTWEDVVALGLEHRWTPRTLTEALRGRDLAALPPLVRTVEGRVVLPRYQWQMLRFLAAEQAHREHREITASDLLEEAVSTALLTQELDWERIEAALPGVRAAIDWPSSE